MMQGKSSLNAGAVPYIPSWKKSSDMESKSTKKIVGSEKHDCGEAAAYQLPDNASLEQSLEKLHVSDEASVHSYKISTEKQSMTDDTNMEICFLMTRFPGYSEKTLAELLDFNNGDLEDTIDLLEEFEAEHMESPGTSEVRHSGSPSK
ncbi:polyadenylate-binding protein-interacting protein 6-like [Asparagus officinalis]|nr:polyadenylate-binding protein-interacting protein 6-like [Asparagus officinalis]XP_020251804.1 polyadenylate-binding protein-interacting protein 6-like [Asparagus officinalis]